MTDRKPRVLATRLFPEDVETRLSANFDVRLNPKDELYDGPSLVKAAEGFDGIMCAAGDALSAATIEAATREMFRIMIPFELACR